MFGLSGLFHKSGVSNDSAIALIELLAKNDNESDVRNAVSTVEATFEKDANVVAESKYLLARIHKFGHATVADSMGDTFGPRGLARFLEMLREGEDKTLGEVDTFIEKDKNVGIA